MSSSTDVQDDSGPGATIESESSTGLDSNIAGALSYLFGFITGLIFFLIEQDDEFVRFHAAQSMVVFGGIFVISIILSIVGTVVSTVMMTGTTGGFLAGGIISLVLGLVWLVLWLGSLGLWLYLMIRAYQGSTPRIPVAAGIADSLAN